MVRPYRFDLTRGDFHGFIAGHSFGQYVSGLARAYAVTGSEPDASESQSAGQRLR